jgi:predicted amidohydrolase
MRTKLAWATSLIVRPDGEIIGEVNPATGFAVVDVDLNFRYDSTAGSDFENRNRAERRPNLCGDLSADR